MNIYRSIPYERLHSRDDLFSASQKITAEDRMSSSSSSDSLNLSTPELDRSKTNQLINLDIDEDDHVKFKSVFFSIEKFFIFRIRYYHRLLF